MRQLIQLFVLKITAQIFPRTYHEKLYIKWHQIALCFLIPTLIMACSASLHNVKPDQSLKAEEGILVIHFHPSYEGLYGSTKLPFKIMFTSAGKTFPDKQIKITSPDYLKVIALPAGEYKWFSINLSQYSRAFSEDSSFVIQAGKMHYLGDIYCHFNLWLFGVKGNILVKDKYEDVLKLLDEDYPSMVHKYVLLKSLTSMKFR
jgi:hypothetical protein